MPSATNDIDELQASMLRSLASDRSMEAWSSSMSFVALGIGGPHSGPTRHIADVLAVDFYSCWTNICFRHVGALSQQAQVHGPNGPLVPLAACRSVSLPISGRGVRAGSSSRSV